MGQDIHIYQERYNGKGWRFVARHDMDRYYLLFSLLAAGRMGQSAKYPPRGLPPEVSPHVYSEATETAVWGRDLDYMTVLNGRTCYLKGDWHTCSWLTRDEVADVAATWQTVAAALIAAENAKMLAEEPMPIPEGLDEAAAQRWADWDARHRQEMLDRKPYDGLDLILAQMQPGDRLVFWYDN